MAAKITIVNKVIRRAITLYEAGLGSENREKPFGKHFMAIPEGVSEADCIGLELSKYMEQFRFCDQPVFTYRLHGVDGQFTAYGEPFNPGKLYVLAWTLADLHAVDEGIYRGDAELEEAVRAGIPVRYGFGGRRILQSGESMAMVRETPHDHYRVEVALVGQSMTDLLV